MLIRHKQDKHPETRLICTSPVAVSCLSHVSAMYVTRTIVRFEGLAT